MSRRRSHEDSKRWLEVLRGPSQNGYGALKSSKVTLERLLVVARQVTSGAHSQDPGIPGKITNPVRTPGGVRPPGAALQPSVNDVGYDAETRGAVRGRVGGARGPSPGHNRVAGGLVSGPGHPEIDGCLPSGDRVSENGPRGVKAVEADGPAGRDVVVVPGSGPTEW